MGAPGHAASCSSTSCASCSSRPAPSCMCTGAIAPWPGRPPSEACALRQARRALGRGAPRGGRPRAWWLLASESSSVGPAGPAPRRPLSSGQGLLADLLDYSARPAGQKLRRPGREHMQQRGAHAAESSRAGLSWAGSPAMAHNPGPKPTGRLCWLHTKYASPSYASMQTGEQLSGRVICGMCPPFAFSTVLQPAREHDAEVGAWC